MSYIAGASADPREGPRGRSADRWTITLFCLALISPGIAPARDGSGRPPVQVVVASVERLPLAAKQWVPATVFSRDEARVAAEQAGRLTEVAELGETLAKGGTLFRLDDYAESQERAIAEANIDRESARIRFLDKETERLQRLARTNNAAQTQLEKTASELAVARAERQAARARLREIDERLRRMHPEAPYHAIVVERIKRPGEWVGKGDDVIVIADDRHLEIRATAALTSLPYVHVGQRLAVEQRGRSGYEAAGLARVRYVVSAGDPQTHRFMLRLEPPAGSWTIGQVVRLAVPVMDERAVLAVPRDALVLRPQGNAVYRVGDDGQAERIAVETGVAEGALIEVRGGLEPGDRVIVRGAERIRPGQRVRIMGAARDTP